MVKQDQTFLTLLGRLFANWPVDEKRAPALSREYYALFNEWGEARFSQAVSSIIRESGLQFFPTIAEFRGYVPASARKPYCGSCESGWVRVPDYEARRLYGHPDATAMRRCECRSGPGYQDYEKRVFEWRGYGE